MKKLSLAIICLFSATLLFAQIPVITSFTPATGAIGTPVTINGNNFSTTPANNAVYFGSVQATVTAATATSLTVNVPFGSGFSPVTVTVNNLTAYASKPFIVTYPDGGMDFTASSFAAAANFTGGCNLIDGDFDGDGKIDMVYSIFSENRVFVHRNTGSGTTLSFASPVYFTGGLVNVIGLDKGDFNGDGKLDFVASTLGNGIYIYRNGCTPGNIFFFGPTGFSTGAYPRKVTVADFDGDGKPDIVTSNQDDNTVSVFRNTTTTPATISFAAKVDFAVSLLPEDIAAGDLDGDGKPEIVVSCSDANAVAVLRNTSTSGTVSFAAKVDLATQTYPWGVAIGDLDGDGKPEVVASNLGPNSVSVFKNTSTGAGTVSFAGAVNFTTASSPRGIKIGDINADGKPDIAAACYFSSSLVSVLKNTSAAGTISFASKLDYGTTTGPGNLVIADMNNDGLSDIVSANSNAGNLTFLRNQLSINTTSAVRNISTVSIELEVYPNPAANRVFIKHPFTTKNGAQIRITDVAGNLVQKIDVKNQTRQTIINTNQLQTGMYIINWFNGNERGSVKLKKD